MDSKRDEVDGELLSKLKSCRKDLRSREVGAFSDGVIAARELSCMFREL